MRRIIISIETNSEETDPIALLRDHSYSMRVERLSSLGMPMIDDRRQEPPPTTPGPTRRRTHAKSNGHRRSYDDRFVTKIGIGGNEIVDVEATARKNHIALDEVKDLDRKFPVGSLQFTLRRAMASARGARTRRLSKQQKRAAVAA